MRSLPLLVLLLFTVVVCTAISPAQMKELLGDGSPRRLRSYNWLYLTDERPAIDDLTIWTMPKQDRLQDWTIEQINENEVAIKANRGFYLGHGDSDYASEAQAVHESQIFTPVKNDADGSWSFKSRENKWLSSHSYYYEKKRHYVTFEGGNNRCEHWTIEPYTPPATPSLIDELLANGGKRIFRSFNELYLTEDRPSENLWALEKWNLILTNPQQWTIEQMNNNEVAIKSHRNLYIRHSSGDWATKVAVPDKWTMLTPVKNAGGTWSFKSQDDKWLSGHTKENTQRKREKLRYKASFEPKNGWCEHWRLELA